MRTRLVVVGPLPPPVHGVTRSTQLVLANPLLAERFDVRHLDTSDRRDLDNLGRWDAVNVLLGVRNLAGLLRLLGPRDGVLYLPLSQNAAAFARDSLFIHAAALRGWKVTIHLRGSELREFYAGSGRLLRAWIRLTGRRIASAAVLGSSLRALFDGVVPLERVAVVPNGTPPVEAGGAAREPGTVLFLSNLLRRKGVVESLAAALLVVAEEPAARFLFAGTCEDAALDRELRERAEAAAGRIEFLPVTTGAARDALYARASIFLFPPREPEGQPRAILEAMSAGLPVVSTDRGAIAETVADGVTGFVLDDPDPDGLADRLLRLLRDPDLCARMGAAGRERYEAAYTQEEADRALAEWLSAIARDEPARVAVEAAR